MPDQGVHWVLEPTVFPCSHDEEAAAVLRAGHRVLRWDDDWLAEGRPPDLGEGEAVVFHGSLGVAAEIRRRLPWRPGAYCDVEAFRCSRWYGAASRWLLHRQHVATTAAQLVNQPGAVLASLGAPERFFVRPDSPLKPFSGRVLTREQLAQAGLAALDHGFYYDDPELPVVVMPVRQVGREWRYVVVDGQVVAGSAYQAEGRVALPEVPGGEPWALAAEVAAALPPPEGVYVLDVCESDGQLWLLELNPFSGADLYTCPRDAVVAAVSRAALEQAGGGGGPAL